MPIRPKVSPLLDNHSLATTFDDLANTRAIERLWTRDHTLWKPNPTEIDNRLGWLTVLDHMQDGLSDLRSFAQAAREARTTDVVLLGMGGSSLGPEVLRCTFGSSKGAPRLWVLDSTVPGWVRQVTNAIQPARTLFLVASKSGGTIEVMSLFAHFWELVHRTKGHRGGAQFVAITDPATGPSNSRESAGSGAPLPISRTLAGATPCSHILGWFPRPCLDWMWENFSVAHWPCAKPVGRRRPKRIQARPWEA